MVNYRGVWVEYDKFLEDWKAGKYKAVSNHEKVSFTASILVHLEVSNNPSLGKIDLQDDMKHVLGKVQMVVGESLTFAYPDNSHTVVASFMPKIPTIKNNASTYLDSLDINALNAADRKFLSEAARILKCPDDFIFDASSISGVEIPIPPSDDEFMELAAACMENWNARFNFNNTNEPEIRKNETWATDILRVYFNIDLKIHIDK